MRNIFLLLSLLALALAIPFVGATVAMQYGPVAGIVAAVLFVNFAGTAILTASRGYCLGVTIPADLKLDTILDTALEEFSKMLLPLRAFSTVFNDVMLQGTDKIVVPYYTLETAASKDFNGVYLFDDGSHDSREVTINKRKYQSLSLSSKEIARQPYLNAEVIGRMKGKKLAEDVLKDILSIVTLANYGNHIWSGAADSFDVNDVSDIETALTNANWPASGRNLLLNPTYSGALRKDEPLLFAEHSGDGGALLRTGQVQPIFGFEGFYSSPVIPGNGETLVGMACFPSCILTAFSPIEPAADVRQGMTDYRAVSDPETGITLEYRQWGDPNTDTSRRVIEANYGFDKGEAAALKRIITTAP